MFDFILADENLPFTVALAVMFGIALLEGVTSLMGLALSQALETLMPEFDFEVDAGMGSELDPGVSVEMESPAALSRFLGWLRVGRVPMLMLLVIFLTGFGLIGLSLQSFVDNLFGTLLPGLLMSIPAVFLALPVVRVFGGVLSKIMPGDETDAVSEESFVGLIATITLGTAKQDSPAEAKIRDVHGTTHYIMIEPDNTGAEFNAGESVLLVRKDGPVFKAIVNPNSALVD